MGDRPSGDTVDMTWLYATATKMNAYLIKDLRTAHSFDKDCSAALTGGAITLWVRQHAV
jgi:hypothetical protein